MSKVSKYYAALRSKIMDEVSTILNDEEKKASLRDPHSKRAPRPCGLTIHTGIGCTMGCSYCYIGDMGFPTNSIKPYPLSGVQLVYALLNNKYFLPGERGTLIAIGSVTEPFHPAVLVKTLEYIWAVKKYLGNYIQFSTKAYISMNTALKVAAIDPGISPLITLVSINYSSELERNAPRPEIRLESIRNLREAGLKPVLFLRPIIPGITDKEYVEIIDKAAEYGAVGVVAGGLRVTPRIISNLKEAGADIREIERRLRIPLEKMREGVQYNIDVADIKKNIAAYTRRKGLKYFPLACMANIYSHGESCWRMISMGITDTAKPLYKPEKDVIEELLREIGCRGGFKGFSNGFIRVSIRSKCDKVLAGEVIKYWFRACPVFTGS
ncbi:MAG: radical SAM protein [Desulfurococcus sp.]|uniref:radical SAM protein n=1 Tax=Desulfurococcus sp. TaxID=51678 RepID=UPI003D0C7040